MSDTPTNETPIAENPVGKTSEKDRNLPGETSAPSRLREWYLRPSKKVGMLEILLRTTSGEMHFELDSATAYDLSDKLLVKVAEIRATSSAE